MKEYKNSREMMANIFTSDNPDIAERSACCLTTLHGP